jgi:anti-sigma B factor antagonist
MRISVEIKDGIAILKISERMLFDETLFLLRRHVRDALASGIRRFIFDISEVPFLDSSGCGELICVHTSIAREQGSLAIVNPQQRVRLLLDRIRLNRILEIVDSLEQAETILRSRA